MRDLNPGQIKNCWTDDEFDILKKRWAKGDSATEIAADMPGRTRNSVIGKVARHGLSSEGRNRPANPRSERVVVGIARVAKPKAPPKVRTAYGPRKAKAEKPAKAPGSIAPSWTSIVHADPGVKKRFASYGKSVVEIVLSGAGVESPNPRPLLEATGCKWPLGEKPTLYCCNPIAGGDGIGRSYCEDHAKKAVEKVQPQQVGTRLASFFARFDRVEKVAPPATVADNDGWERPERGVA